MSMKALIIVDPQNDFVTGTLAVPGAQAVIDRIKRLLDQNDYDHIVATQDWHIDTPGVRKHWGTWGEHCRAYTEGAHLVADLDPSPVEFVFKKGQYTEGYSGFEGVSDGQTLGSFLKEHEVTEVDIVGLAFDHCVKATALDAVTLGFTARVLTDLTAAVDVSNLIATVKELTAAGVEVV
jgi:nicotinamidase/pyrazinamidase